MIESVIIKYLNDNLTDIKAYMEEPEKASGQYVVIEKTGSRTTDKITSSTFAIQSYGASLLDACLVNDMVKEWMDKIVILPEIGSCRLNSDYNWTDTTKKKYRYQAIFDITHY